MNQLQQNGQDWPIFTESCDYSKNIKFWKNETPYFSKKNILFQTMLYRLGKKKQTPCIYQYSLTKEGYLYYEKGWIKLEPYFILRLVDLKNQDNDQTLSAIRIRQSKTNQLYLWSQDQQTIQLYLNYTFIRQVTYKWIKYLQQFVISQNFDAFYNLKDLIANGGFAKVFKVSPSQKLDFQNSTYAAKVYNKEQLTQKGQLKKFKVKNVLQCECFLLKRLQNHPYIMQLNEVIQLDDVVSNKIIIFIPLVIISEYISGGTLYDYLKRKQTLDENEALQITYQIGRALQDIHKLGYVHRDIKLENVLIEQENPIKVKLIDFGFAEVINRLSLKSGQGTAGFIAPEIFKMQPYTEKSDMFSLGVILFALISGNSPFSNNHNESILESNKQCRISFNEECWKDVGEQTLSILKGLLEPISEFRIDSYKFMQMLDERNEMTKKQLGRSSVKTRDSRMLSLQDIQEASEIDYKDVEQGIDQINLKKLRWSQKIFNQLKFK